MKVKNVLGSDSRFQILKNSQTLKNEFLENTKPGDTKLCFFQVFSSPKIKFETERPSGVFWSILTGGAFFFPHGEREVIHLNSLDYSPSFSSDLKK